MLNSVIEQKPEFLKAANAVGYRSNLLVGEVLGSSCVQISAAILNYAEVANLAESTYFARSVLKSSYKWISPTSLTARTSSPVEVMKALLIANDKIFETSREGAVAAVQSTLISVYELDRGGFGRVAAQEVMLFIEKSLRNNKIAEANMLLELADFSKLSSRSLIGLIRSTARLREQLPAWRIAYLNSRKEVEKQGKNPDMLFIGLPTIAE
jgi:hypothetical protein